MRIVNGLIDGDLTVTEATTLNGMVTGSVTVWRNNVLVVNGLVQGDVIAQERSRLEVHGTIDGTLRNEEAHVEIWGVVNVLQDARVPHAAIVHPDAVVERRI